MTPSPGFTLASQAALIPGATMAPIPPFVVDPLYPSSDGKPMAENTDQYQWLVLIAENIMALFADRPDVFVAADLLWYALQHHQKVAGEPIVQAPDVMVVWGRPPGHRMSYKQWEEDGIPPQVVFEVLSPSNTTREGRREMQRKFEFYQRHGVEEYYCYDPSTQSLQVWLRQGDRLEPLAIPPVWHSPRLGVLFQWVPGQPLGLFYPNGEPFMNLQVMHQLRQQAQLQTQQAQFQAEQAQLQAQQAQLEAQQAQLQTQQAQFQAQQAQLQAQQAEAEKERLAQYLRSIGLDPQNLPPL
jgi:Uma2 family endonuclease